MKHFAISFLAAAAVALSAAPDTTEPLIRLNQIGYLPAFNKVAVIADPQQGYNAEKSFTPGPTYQVRRWADDSVAFEGATTAWNSGATDAQSGDRGWWFDFSALETEGDYYLWDAQNAVGSHRFSIRENVYADIMKAAVRMFFYQRCAFEKTAEFAGEDWADGPAFIHPGQDTEARSVLDRDNPATERDLSGGWMDAGDYNKYVTFAATPVHQMLAAYELYPDAFTDDYNIPESGNGIPDLLDEVHFEMLWLAKMQEPDGSVIAKLGETDHSGSTPPSTDTRPRYYVPPCSSSTIAAAGMYAHAALVFQGFEPWAEFAATLESQAIDAWNAYHANAKQDNCDDQTVKSGDSDWTLDRQRSHSRTVAMYLHRLTGEEQYGDYAHAEMDRVLSKPSPSDTDPQPFQWDGWYAIYHPHLMGALLGYANSGLAAQSLVDETKTRYLALEQSGEGEFDWKEDRSLYRAFMSDSRYDWGSNNLKSRLGIALNSYQAYGYHEADLPERRLQAENLLHYFLGVNPMGLVYLTNMSEYGAEVSASQIYHTWFAHGSAYDANPAPGYLPGGPNKNYTPTDNNWDEINAPLQNALPQKSYLDFNHGWPWDSWQVTEPAIYYQAAFIHFLAAFVEHVPPAYDLADPDADGLVNTLETWLALDPNSFSRLDERISIVTTPGGYSLRVESDPQADADAVRCLWSSDLQNWQELDLEAGQPTETIDPRIVKRYFLSTASPRAFVRFLVGNTLQAQLKSQ